MLKHKLLILGAIAAFLGGSATPLHSLPLPQDGDRSHRALIALDAEENVPAIIELEDLPAGFREPPPAIASQISAQFLALSDQFRQGGLDPDEFFIFYHPRTLEVVFGFTGEIDDPGQFDLNLQLLKESPALQETIIAQIEEKLANVDLAELTELRVVPTDENLGNNSIGVKAGLQLLGMNFQGDLVSFRRENTGGFAAVMYRQSQTPNVTINTLAGTMDRKIIAIDGIDLEEELDDPRIEDLEPRE